MACIDSALIVGGGPAGLAAAITLHQAGVEVDLVEITTDRTVLGSELLISSPNLRLLDGLGLADSVVAAGVPIDSCQFYTADGTHTASIPTPNVGREGLPPSVGITRSAFYGVIYEGALRAGARILHGTTVDRLENSGPQLRATLSSGAVQNYDLVVGADGCASRVRQLRFPDAPGPEFSGQSVWRAKIETSGTHEYAGYFGATRNAGIVPVDENHAYLFCLVNEATPSRPSSEDYPAILKAELAEFGGDVAWARDHLGGPETMHYAPMWVHVMPKPWHDDRAILIGDAAHSATPHIGYGAGLATEDGITLGEEVANADTLGEALSSFMQRRFDRCETVINAGRQMSRWQQGLDSPTPTSIGELLAQTWAFLERPF